MMWGVTFTLSLILADVVESIRLSPPGKPRLTSCRSPEKETFTCWWEPGPDGGLPTVYSLFYRKENSDTVHECPDYHTAGKNSCFFNKNDTSIWVNYNITVVATNALGSTVSDPVDVDVVYIVQPHMPENVTVVVQEVDGNDPSLLVRWEPPHKADTRSGWITLVYELRVKLEREEKWEEHFAGQQKQFNIFSPHSGEVYMVQVRCKPDHGFWSEWSSTSYVTVPDYINRETSMWILMGVIGAVAFVVITWTAHEKRDSVKLFLLPPVPGPKIKGFDTQLLKAGKSEALDHLVIQGFPSITAYEDLLVEHFEVSDVEQELVLDGKNSQEGHLKPKDSSDSDSGRGSCDSHTLLMEKCGEPKVDKTAAMKEKVNQAGGRPPIRSNSHGYYTDADTNRSWPTVFSSELPVNKPSYRSIPEISKHTLGNNCPATHKQDNQENILDGTHLRKLQQATNSEFNISDRSTKGGFPLKATTSMDYVEVQEVEQENALVLKPTEKAEQDLYQLEFTGQDYSRVNGVVNDKILLLQRETAAEDQGPQSSAENKPQQQAGKPQIHTAVQLTANGYVDTATVLPTVTQAPTQGEAS